MNPLLCADTYVDIFLNSTMLWSRTACYTALDATSKSIFLFKIYALASVPWRKKEFIYDMITMTQRNRLLYGMASEHYYIQYMRHSYLYRLRTRWINLIINKSAFRSGVLNELHHPCTQQQAT